MTKIQTDKILPIVEIYPALQGEGSRPGRPTIIIRTTGCTHRCFFNNGGWCDSWYTSIHPEKGKFIFNDITYEYEKFPYIKEMMLTGGSPTMHPELVNVLSTFCHSNGIFLTIETEGSAFVRTDYPIHLVSLSPKFSNTIPVIGSKTPLNKIVDQKMIDQHNKFRLNYDAIRQMIDYHSDYHYKPVYDGRPETLEEIEQFRVRLSIPKEKTFVMPAGGSREELIFTYGDTMEMCLKMGYNFTGRPHIIAYDMKRCV